MNFAQVFTEEVPWNGLRDGNVIIEVCILDNRPSRPGESALERGLSDSVWKIMEACWKTQPNDRPEMVTVLSQLLMSEHERKGQGEGSVVLYNPLSPAPRQSDCRALSDSQISGKETTLTEAFIAAPISSTSEIERFHCENEEDTHLRSAERTQNRGQENFNDVLGYRGASHPSTQRVFFKTRCMQIPEGKTTNLLGMTAATYVASGQHATALEFLELNRSTGWSRLHMRSETRQPLGE